MKEILLSNGKVVLVDEEDYTELSLFRWHSTGNGYAFRQTPRPNRKSLMMHRQIMGFPSSNVDHINGNKLDNRRSNLRLATVSQNLANSGARFNTKRPYRGVTPVFSRFTATITYGRKCHYLGTFDTAEHAGRVYDFAAAQIFGEFASLNFSPREVI